EFLGPRLSCADCSRQPANSLARRQRHHPPRRDRSRRRCAGLLRASERGEAGGELEGEDESNLWRFASPPASEHGDLGTFVLYDAARKVKLRPLTLLDDRDPTDRELEIRRPAGAASRRVGGGRAAGNPRAR